ncbi:diguanylate cyclase response regulator [Pseudomonas cichorii]|uniref:diguanylate cyclase n=1 Tax=Pseudomonas serbiensis TaxID=3064350 RepID=A0ABT9CU09_9PSED|nr:MULTISPECIES: diguanylate cyclase [Pseudomonas]MDO7928669.1 diguanylate cyclase [Pseudomonas sp. KFB-138]GFM89635.1 diguanylate cyclase response regulator [Pseudomonas cichorii]
MNFIHDVWEPGIIARPKILIVDDQASNILILREIFRESCDIIMATDGQQALTLSATQLPDLVLLDVVMEGTDGHEVCRQLKESPLTQHIPIIFVTAKRDELDEVQGFELGAVDFITKPINPTIVRARVITHLTLKLQSDLLRRSAFTDGLTGVSNRRKFDDMFEQCWRQSERNSTPLSLIMIDVDYFKLYNDRYGHQAGDHCLKSIAHSLSELIRRPFDLLARYGGEEFVCILPHTDISGAARVAESMKDAVDALGMEHLSSDIGQKVTISLGVASTIATPATTPDAFLRETDSQLYMAKKSGRHQVVAAGG